MAPCAELFGDGDTKPTAPNGMSKDGGAAAPVLLEAPRGWMLGDDVLEGEERWMSGDGMVYAPLFCSCSGCRSAHVGEKA
ncbi:unnamed protein product, partial [Laminaria digitata]